MSRAVRITVGSVLVGVLAFVALVAGTMSATSGWDGDVWGGLDDFAAAGIDAPATAEVLDVDDYGDGWPTVDVRFTTPEGEDVVTYVDWEWSDDLPVAGELVEVKYDPSDPEYAFAADDPWLQDGAAEDEAAEGAVGGTVDGAAGEDDPDAAGGGVPAQVAGWVALAALLGVVVGSVVTVVAAVRAPSPSREGYVPGPYEAPHPHTPAASAAVPVGQAFPPRPHAGQPYPGQAYPPQPYAGQPHPGRPWSGQPSPGQPSSGPPPAGAVVAPPSDRWSSPG